MERKETEKGNYYEQLFNEQLRTLNDRGCSGYILKEFRKLKEAVIHTAGELIPETGKIPFLSVIPRRPYCSLAEQMRMVRNNGHFGQRCPYPNLISKESMEIPDQPYYIFSIEPGSRFLQGQLSEIGDILKKDGRRPLTLTENIALCVQTDVLSSHNLKIATAFFGSARRELGIYIDEKNVPYLCCLDGRKTKKPWGVASCRRMYSDSNK